MRHRGRNMPADMVRPPVLERSAPHPATSDISTDSLREGSKRLGTSIYFFLFITTLTLTPILVLSGLNGGFAQILAVIAALVALALVPWRPIVGLYIILI